MENFFRLNKFAVIRHADYSFATGRITPDGIQQMRDLLQPLWSYIGRDPDVIIVSSSAPRAKDSAQIISKELEIPYFVFDELWSDSRHVQLNQPALDVISNIAREKKCRVVIIITHKEYAHDLPRLICERCGCENPGFVEMQKGSMLFIDTNTNRKEKYPD
jgi:phosphohistidine phosphatase SixA